MSVINGVGVDIQGKYKDRIQSSQTLSKSPCKDHLIDIHSGEGEAEAESGLGDCPGTMSFSSWSHKEPQCTNKTKPN